MKEFISELLELLASCILVVCLFLASFLLISNLYHYKDISRLEPFDESSMVQYNEYKKMLSKVDKKMNSVNHDLVQYGSTAKPIYDYYSSCIKSLNGGTFAGLKNKESISAKDIYDSNNEILNNYNRLCIFYIPYNISVITKEQQSGKSFKSVYKVTEEKRQMIISNAEYLTKSGLGNSSYSFTTDVTRSGVYNKAANEFKLTINNYKMMSSILDDVANWYVAEYGGNN